MTTEANAVAAIDCGTNSIRLLIADRVDHRLRDIHREMRIVRLGEGVDATGRFAAEALARTEAALADYAVLLREHGVRKLRMVATSATRDAANRDEFFAMTAGVLGEVAPGAIAEVITGSQEAELSFNGAVGELDSAAAPFVVVDLGGGSTEVVFGDARGVQACHDSRVLLRSARLWSGVATLQESMQGGEQRSLDDHVCGAANGHRNHKGQCEHELRADRIVQPERPFSLEYQALDREVGQVDRVRRIAEEDHEGRHGHPAVALQFSGCRHQQCEADRDQQR